MSIVLRTLIRSLPYYISLTADKYSIEKVHFLIETIQTTVAEILKNHLSYKMTLYIRIAIFVILCIIMFKDVTIKENSILLSSDRTLIQMFYLLA